MHGDGLVAGQANLDRCADQVGHQRRVSLHRQVFLAAKAAAVGNQRDAHRLQWQPQLLGDLHLVFVDTLAL